MAVAAALLAACGGTTPAGPAMDAAPADVAPTADAPTADRAEPADAAADVSPDAAPLTQNLFVLSTGSFQRSAAAGGGGLTNLVFNNVIAAEGERCAVRRDGPCYVTDCFERGDDRPLRGVSAGGVFESVPSQRDAIGIDPMDDGLYPNGSTPMPVWGAGDRVTLRAEGAQMPAFEVALMVPAALQRTSPPASTGLVMLDRGMPFTFAWSAPTAGTAIVTIQQSPLTDALRLRDLRIVCEFPASAGTATVPGSVMALLRPQGEGVDPALNLGAADVRDLTVGGYRVHVTAILAASLAARVR